MSKPKSCLIVLFVLLLAQPCLAITGIPDLGESEAFIAFTGPGIPSLMVVPDGSGPGFTGAHDEQGNVVDATITLFVRDGLGYPIVNFPREDMWIGSVDGGLVACTYGPRADQNTDINGMTMWTNPPFAGGSSLGPVQVFINGMAITRTPPLPLKFNSPDINGDLAVNLYDISLLSGDYYSAYNFRSDLNGDGVLNIQDLPLFARHFGSQCP